MQNAQLEWKNSNNNEQLARTNFNLSEQQRKILVSSLNAKRLSDHRNKNLRPHTRTWLLWTLSYWKITSLQELSLGWSSFKSVRCCFFFLHSHSLMIPSRNKTHFTTIRFDHVSFCISTSLDFKAFFRFLCLVLLQSNLKVMSWWFHFNDREDDVLLAHLTVFRHTIRRFKRLMSTLLKKRHSYNDTGFHCSSCNETISVVNCKKQS